MGRLLKSCTREITIIQGHSRPAEWHSVVHIFSQTISHGRMGKGSGPDFSQGSQVRNLRLTPNPASLTILEEYVLVRNCRVKSWLSWFALLQLSMSRQV